MKKIIPIPTLVLILSACGGGGDSSTSNSKPALASLQVTPALGAFTSGTVKIMKSDGSVAASGSLVGGSATLSAALGCEPAIIEVSNGTFYDEGLDQMASMGSAPLRAALGCFSGQGSATVTALTELAYRKLGTARDSASIDSANSYIRTRYAPEVTSLLKIPTKVASLDDAKNVGINSKPATAEDIYAIRLAALSVVAKMRSMSTMQLISNAGDNLVQNGSIDGAAANNAPINSLSADYLTAIVDYTTKVAAHMTGFATRTVSSAGDPPVMQRVEFARLMRLLSAIPGKTRYILTQDNPKFEVQVKGLYAVPCSQMTDGGNGTATYQSCPAGAVLPFSESTTMTGTISATNIPSNQIGGYRYAQRVNAALDVAGNARMLHVEFSGNVMNAYIGDYPGVLPAIWPVGFESCTSLDLRNATVILKQDSDVLNFSNVDICVDGDWGKVSPNASYLDTRYAVRGIGPNGQTFSNASTPLIFRRPGVLVDVVNSPGTLLVSGKLTVPVAADRSITVEANDVSGTMAKITITTTSGGGASQETVLLPVSKLLQHAVY